MACCMDRPIETGGPFRSQSQEGVQEEEVSDSDQASEAVESEDEGPETSRDRISPEDRP